MGIISFSYLFSQTPALSVLLAPLQTLAAMFVPVNPASCNGVARSASKPTCRAPDAQVENRVESANHTMVNRLCPHQPVARNACAGQSPKPPIRRLKILREFDPGVGQEYAGRMIISGRMADVCAELERMEQYERTTCHH